MLRAALPYVSMTLAAFGLGLGFDAKSESDAEREVLAANEAFYEAFATGEFVRMEALWARDVPVAVIHPGWPGVDSREDVIQSWRSILSAPPTIQMVQAKAFVLGDTAFVVCYEVLNSGTLVATNIFHRENGQWKVVHHHAGPTTLIISPGEPV